MPKWRLSRVRKLSAIRVRWPVPPDTGDCLAGGASISLLRLDAELKALIAKPARTPFFEQIQL